MKSYNQIYFTINAPIETFLSAIENSLTDGWIRDENADKRFKEIAGDDAASHYFHCDKRGSRWAATVILTRVEPEKYYLSHVQPNEDSPNPFEPDQFNAIANEFLENFLRPLEQKDVLFILNFDGTIDLEVELGTELFKKLRAFSGAANKATRSAHPLDRERWFDFITSIAQADVELHPSDLKRWLREEGGWSDEVAHELALEFEFGQGLLDHKNDA